MYDDNQHHKKRNGGSSNTFCIFFVVGGDLLPSAGSHIVHALPLPPVPAAGGDEAGARPVRLDRPPPEAGDGGYAALDPPLAVATPLHLLPPAPSASPAYTYAVTHTALSRRCKKKLSWYFWISLFFDTRILLHVHKVVFFFWQSSEVSFLQKDKKELWLTNHEFVTQANICRDEWKKSACHSNQYIYI